MRNSVSCLPLLNIHIRSIFLMLSGIVCSRVEHSLPICEAVRSQEMGESDLVRGERCLYS